MKINGKVTLNNLVNAPNVYLSESVKEIINICNSVEEKKVNIEQNEYYWKKDATQNILHEIDNIINR